MDDLIDDVAADVESQFSVEYKDPYKRPYGDPERQTPSQAKSWSYLKRGVWRQAMIGAKGAGKSWNGAAFAFHFGQQNPGSQGAIVAGDYQQAKDSAGDAFVQMSRNLGYDTEYFGSKKIRGQQYSRFYAVDLDGSGFDGGLYFLLFVRSLESAESMEGSEIDFMWVEEIQHADKQPFVKASSRNRGTNVAGPDTPNPLYIAGMTGGRQHWMYKIIEKDMEFQTDDNFDVEEFDQHRRVEEGGVGGVLFEPNLQENVQNVGQSAIDDYYSMFDETKAERLIHARRVSKNQDRALYSYRDRTHTTGKMSQILAEYSPYQDLILSFDFNVSPMCVSAWQKKRWNDAWRSEDVQIIWNDPKTQIEEVRVWYEPEDGDEPIYDDYESLEAWKAPDTDALVQVDEWEVWPDDELGGGTRGVMKHIVQDYAKQHQADLIVLGDARGNDTSSSSVKTDWDIIREYTSVFGETDIIPGLQSNKVVGEVKWSNPPVKDTLNNANAVLLNGEGEARMCFLPESEYPSGGVSGSVAATETGPNGKIDKKRDRSDDREKPRTHFLDTVRYVAWWYTEGAFMSVDSFSDALDEMEEMERESQGITVPDGDNAERYGPFPDEGDGSDWGNDTDLIF